MSGPAADPEAAAALTLADDNSPSTSPRCAAAAARTRAQQQQRPQLSRRQRRAAAAVAAAARPLASALALGLSIGLLAGSAWHLGRSQALRVSAVSVAAPRLASSSEAVASTTPAAAPATPSLPPYPPPPTIPPGEKGDTIHVVFTSNGSPYGNFQGRLHYASFLRARRSGGGGGGGASGGGAANGHDPKTTTSSKLVAFTRVLHRSTDDALVHEIPTFRADPLEPACDTWCEFPVKDRAHAVKQWLSAAAAAAADADAAADEKNNALIKAPWILMLETDYVWRYPLVAPGDASDPNVKAQAFLFDYMAPQAPAVRPFVEEMCGGRCSAEQVLASGPAPVLLRVSELRAAVDDWVRLSAWIEARKDAREALGWVREMYAWCVAAARAGLRFEAAAPPRSPLALQPPHDALPGLGSSSEDNAPAAVPIQPALFHYTWGAIFHDNYSKEGPELWRFDKRDYTSAADAERPPALALPPPWKEGLVLQDGVPVTRELRDTLAEMVGLMNAAGAELLMTGAGAKGPAT